MNNIFNVTGMPSDDEEFSVGGVQPSQPTQPAVGRPRKEVSYKKPFDKYMDEEKDTSKAAPMTSPLLAKSGKGLAEADLGGASKTSPFPSSFKDTKSSAFPSSFSSTQKSTSSVSSHKSHEPGTASFQTTKASTPKAAPVKQNPNAVAPIGGETLEGENFSLDELAPIGHKKEPDEVVWGSTSSSVIPKSEAVMGGEEQSIKGLVAGVEGVTSGKAMQIQSKLMPELAVNELLGKDKERGILVEESKSSTKAEDAPIPVLGAEVLTRNVVPPAPVNLAVSGVGPVETRAPTAPPPNTTLQSLVEQIVNRVDTLTKGDRMESVITLKQSPALPAGFEDATIRLTSVATARGEVNITFGGLTQSAAQLVQSNQNDLLNALSARGVVVHIFSVSTQQDPIAMQASQAGSDQQQQQQPFWGQQQQQQRQRDQEEGEYT